MTILHRYPRGLLRHAVQASTASRLSSSMGTRTRSLHPRTNMRRARTARARGDPRAPRAYHRPPSVTSLPYKRRCWRRNIFRRCFGTRTRTRGRHSPPSAGPPASTTRLSRIERPDERPNQYSCLLVRALLLSTRSQLARGRRRHWLSPHHYLGTTIQHHRITAVNSRSTLP